jgi:acetylornithine deacetylase/succinyl-diaminopimelate desuccinylase-like protein
MKIGWVVALGLLASTAHAAAPKLPCAVDGLSRGVKPNVICQALAAQLDRNVTLVNDAREAAKGDAVQIITGDVSWTVIWLIDSHVRAWTRVSKIEPVAEQVKLLARAARELAKQAKTVEPGEGTCVRVDPSRARNPDLSYPWAELSPCKRKLVEVLDPWWVPAKSTDAP